MVRPSMTGTELVASEHLKCLLVSGRKLLAGSDRGQHLGLGFLLELGSDRLEHHHRRVLCIPQVTGRTVGNPDGVVVAGEVIAELDLAGHHADHGEMHSANLHRLAHRGPPAEQLLTHAPAEKHHAAALQFVAGIEPAALGGDFVAHLAIFRAHAADCGRPHHPLAIADARTIHGFQANVFHQRCHFLDDVEIGLLQKHFLAGALAAGLLAGLLRPADHHALAESVEPAHQDVAKAAAVGDQQGNGRDPPDDAQHGQQAARVIAPQGDPGFANDFNQHSFQAR